MISAKKGVPHAFFTIPISCVHTGYDLQAVGKNSFEDIKTIKSVVKNAKTAVAGGIKIETIPEVIKAQPDFIIVGVDKKILKQQQQKCNK